MSAGGGGIGSGLGEEFIADCLGLESLVGSRLRLCLAGTASSAKRFSFLDY